MYSITVLRRYIFTEPQFALYLDIWPKFCQAGLLGCSCSHVLCLSILDTLLQLSFMVPFNSHRQLSI